MRPTLDASLYLLQLVLKCIKKQYYNFIEETTSLLKETITAVLESASRVCTFEAHEDVKKELYRYFTESCNELHHTLEKWFLDCFNRSFGVSGHMQWNDHVAVREIKVVHFKIV